MKFSLLVIATSLAICSFAVTSPYYPAGWVDLYKPPYENLPTIVSSIQCLTSEFCMVSGMTNGLGVGVYKANGQYNGPLEMMNLEGEMPIMIMGLAAGGTPENPHGAAGGPDLIGGLKYLANRTTWSTPLTFPFVTLIGITADWETGQRVMFPDSIQQQVWVSTNGGFEYTAKNTSAVQVPEPNCSFVRFIANPTADVIYLTYGNYPNNSKSRDQLLEELDEFYRKPVDSDATLVFPVSEGVSYEVSRNGKSVKRLRHRRFGPQQDQDEGPMLGGSSSSSSSSVNPYNSCPFSGAVVKSSDGGNTWETVFQDLGSWYPNEIACASATHCVMAVGTPAGAGLMRTTNGKYFTSVFSIDNNDNAIYYLRTVAVSPANSSLWFAAGGMETRTDGDKGFVARSEDGGATWVAETPLNFLAEIIKLSISRDGVAFGAAETLFQSGTIVRYTPNGPPATPAPACNGDITQKVWASGDCTGSANASSFAQGACLQANGGGSLTMSCDMTDGVILQNIYILSNSCEGPYEQGVAAYGTCLQANGGGTVEFYCTAQSSAPRGTVGVSVAKKH